MKGRRRHDNIQPYDLDSGDYAFRGEGESRWLWVRCPNGNGPAMLSNWDVEEHEDGTVTVWPSIHAHANAQHDEWHGYLERGVWRVA